MTPGEGTGTKVSRENGASSPRLAEQLSAHPWLGEALSRGARDALLRGAVERRYAPDEVIYLAGSPAQSLYLVLEGRVRVMRGDGGRAHVLHVEERGGSLGEVPLFEGATYPATTIAAEPTRCLVLSRDAVLGAIRAEPELGLALLARLAARVRLLVERLDRNTGHSTLHRLAELLLERHAAAHGKSFVIAATQQEAAEEIGTVRELVVRGLRTLRQRGVIAAKGGGRYVVTDEAALRTIASDPSG
jgi:CRP/FNR family transcriptional regulator